MMVGLEEWKSSVQGMADLDDRLLRAAVTELLLLIFDRSQYLVPVDIGNLRDTAIHTVSGRGEYTDAAIEYLTYYATIVHEDLQKKHAAPTQAKFLERAVKEFGGQFEAVAYKHLKANT